MGVAAKKVNQNLPNSGFRYCPYAPGPVAAIDEKIQIVGLTNSSSLTIHGITEESRGKTGKAHLTAAVYVEDGSKLNFSGSVLTRVWQNLVNKKLSTL